ncbi:MAG: hypothetical protein K8W52_07035 [Deltaproteobacteria bacterium]|nr:hypothetical protein [Deltaproteobacteria bacterium]
MPSPSRIACVGDSGPSSRCALPARRIARPDVLADLPAEARQIARAAIDRGVAAIERGAVARTPRRRRPVARCEDRDRRVEMFLDVIAVDLLTRRA